MAGRFWEQPKQPTGWKNTDERTFYTQLMDVLENLHLPIKEAWLDEKLKRKITEGGTAKRLNYSVEVQDTGIKWIDGSPIKRVTQTFNVAANTDMNSNDIPSFGTIINAEGYVMTSGGAIYTLGQDVNVWKAGAGAKFKVRSAYSGEASITVYYIEGEVPPAPVGTYILFDNGYVSNIGWSGNLLTRPNYTAQGNADLSRVETDGDMHIYIYSLNSLSYNAHVCTTDKVTIPADATKMYVRAKRVTNSAYMKIGLLSDSYVNACSGDGGVMSNSIAVSTTETDYSVNLPAGFAGSSDYRVVINIQDTAASERHIYITKVWFE